jgi:hypothetical protein
MATYCRDCGTAFAGGTNFCGNCGASRSEDSPSIEIDTEDYEAPEKRFRLWPYAIALTLVTVVGAYAANPDRVMEKIGFLLPTSMTSWLPGAFGRSSCASDETQRTVKGVFRDHFDVPDNTYKIFGITSSSVDKDSKSVSCSSLLTFNAKPENQYKFDFTVQKTIDRDDIYVEVQPSEQLQYVLSWKLFIDWMKSVRDVKAQLDARQPPVEQADPVPNDDVMPVANEQSETQNTQQAPTGEFNLFENSATE